MQNLIIRRSTIRHQTGFFASLAEMFRNVIRGWPLLSVLFKRDFLAVHKRSVLGLTWMFISPLLGIASWVFMNKSGLFHPGDVGVPYPAYLLMGSSMWSLFLGVYGGATDSLGKAASYIVQVNFPHEILLFKEILQQLTNFTISFAVNLCLLPVFGVIPSWQLFLLPLAVIPLCCLAAGIGTLLSLFNSVIPDVRKAWDYFMSLVVFLTPVFYSSKNAAPMVRDVIKWNPLTYLIDVPRSLILGVPLDNLNIFFKLGIACVLFWLVTLRLFYVSEQRVIEKML